MTPKEAIEILKDEHDWSQFLCYVKAALKLAVEALEKQIPKKPVDFGNESYLCPNCRRNNFYDGTETLNKTNFCNYCGQALDWSGKR